MESNWISVKDRFPENGKMVIVNCEYGVTFAEFMSFQHGNTLYYTNIGIGNCEDSNSVKNVTHWMPLPEPPKE